VFLHDFCFKLPWLVSVTDYNLPLKQTLSFSKLFLVRVVLPVSLLFFLSFETGSYSVALAGPELIDQAGQNLPRSSVCGWWCSMPGLVRVFCHSNGQNETRSGGTKMPLCLLISGPWASKRNNVYNCGSVTAWCPDSHLKSQPSEDGGRRIRETSFTLRGLKCFHVYFVCVEHVRCMCGQAIVSYLTWMLGDKCHFVARGASAFNCWGLSPPTNHRFYYCFYFICVCALPAHMSKQHMHVCCPCRLKEAIGFPGTGVTDRGCELPCGRCDTNLGPQEEHPVLLTTQPSLQPWDQKAILFLAPYSVWGQLVLHEIHFRTKIK